VQRDMLPASVGRIAGPSRPAAIVDSREETPWFSQRTGANELVPTPPASVAVPVPPSSPKEAAAGSAAAVYDPGRVRPLLEVEREVVDYALRAFGGNVAQAARALQVNPSTLYRKIQAWTAQDGMPLGQAA
jgi:two-component system, repressor protein LuxO